MTQPPADPAGATHALAILMVVGAGYFVLQVLLVPDSAGGEFGVAMLLAAGMGAAGVATWLWGRALPSRVWTAIPFASSLFISSANLITSDATTGSQLFLLWPVLFAATYLTVPQTTAMLVVTATGGAVVAFSLLPARVAATDVASLVTALAMAAAVVAVLRRRNAVLVAALAAQALEDQLTGLPNRRALERSLAAALARSERSGAEVSLLTADLDGFKDINDRLGHTGGDEALREVAASLLRTVRAGDMVARLGGDEFVMLLPECGAEAAMRVADAARALIAAGPSGLTISVGVATVPDHAATAADLFRASDAALYAAKHGGRDRVVRAAASGSA